MPLEACFLASGGEELMP